METRVRGTQDRSPPIDSSLPEVHHHSTPALAPSTSLLRHRIAQPTSSSRFIAIVARRQHRSIDAPTQRHHQTTLASPRVVDTEQPKSQPFRFSSWKRFQITSAISKLTRGTRVNKTRHLTRWRRFASSDQNGSKHHDSSITRDTGRFNNRAAPIFRSAACTCPRPFGTAQQRLVSTMTSTHDPATFTPFSTQPEMHSASESQHPTCSSAS
jgi:hypothetical protein